MPKNTGRPIIRKIRNSGRKKNSIAYSTATITRS
jgi:hypothetical protein